MLVLSLKAAEFFLETKIRITRCEKSRFYPVLARIRIKKSGQIEDFLQRKTFEIIRTTSFIRFERRSGLTEVYCKFFEPT